MKKIFFTVALLGLFFLNLSAQGYQQPLYSISSAQDSGYMITTQFYQGIRGVPFYIPIQTFINRYASAGFTEANTFYVDPNGNNTTGLKGRQDKPFLDPWAAIDSTTGQIAGILKKGDYRYTGPYNTSDVTAFSLINRLKTSISAPESSISYTGALSGNFFISDRINSTTSVQRSFSLALDSLHFTTTAAIQIPFTFYHPESEVNINLRKLKIDGASRSWGFQFQSKKVNLSIDEVDIDGDMIGWSSSAIDSLFHEISIGDVYLGMRGDDIAIIQNNSSGRNQFINWKIGRIFPNKAANSIQAGLLNWQGNMKQGYNSLSIDYIDWTMNNIPGSLNSYTVPLSQSGSPINATADSSTYILNIKKADWKGQMLANFETIAPSAEGSIYEVNLGEFTHHGSGSPFIISNMILDNTQIIFNCEKCEALGTAESFFWIGSNVTLLNNAKIIIRGNYKVAGAVAVINTRVPIYFEGVVENDGTVAAIQSDAPGTNIFVSGAFDENTIIADADVNIVRLDEYGGGGGGDGNGIISALPLGNVTIDATLNDFTINNLDVLNFNTDATGSAKSTMRLTRSAAVPLRLSHENPADVLDAGELILDFDGNTQLKGGDGQDVAIEANTAPVQLIADSVRVTNLAAQPVHDNYTYEIKANSTGYLVPVTRSYAYMAFSNAVSALTPTGSGTYDQITNVGNTLFTDIAQTGDFTAASDQITINRDGFVKIDFSASINTPAGSISRVKILKNGTAQTGGAMTTNSSSSEGVVFAGVAAFPVVDTDIITIGFEAVTGGPVTILAGNIFIEYK